LIDLTQWLKETVSALAAPDGPLDDIISKTNNNRLTGLELHEAGNVLVAAINRWLEEDIDNFVSIEKPEKEFLASNGTKGIIDLIATIAPDPPSNAYKPHAGKRIIVDWKTTAASVKSDSWKTSYLNSWQWRIYSEVERADLFSYRGISRQDLDVRTFMITVPTDNAHQVSEFIRMTRLQMNSLINEPYWPRSWPSPCSKWGGCAFYTDCFNNTQPPALIQIPDHLSYSKLSAFTDCPEKYRRLNLLGTEKAENENTIFGNIVHAGLAYVYEHVFSELGRIV